MHVPGVEIPHLCFQCEDYPCINVCPTGALSLSNKTGAVIVNSSKCTGCGLCIEACPAKVPHMHPSRGCILICDLCDGRPACVEACQEGGWNALKLVKRKKKSYKALAKDPDQLTREVAKKLYGDDIAEEVVG